MSVPSSPQTAEWQSTRVPKLGYRKPLPPDELDKYNAQVREAVPKASSVSRTESTASTATRSTVASTVAPPPKKKGSFLGGLFAKEPTLTALAQVEADLKAKHGAATPQKVPHVSSRKMPEHVPKVNSKWDGVPEAIKTRDREEKQRRRMSQRNSIVPPQSARSESTDDSGHEMHHSDMDTARRESDAGSQSDSWREQDDLRPPRRSSANSAGSEDSRGLNTSNNVPNRSASLRSSSETNIAGITAFFAHQEQKPLSPGPQQAATVGHQAVSNHVRPNAVKRSYPNPAIDIVPEHSASPLNTPRELSPVTPSYLSDNSSSPVKQSFQQANAGARSARHVVRAKAVPIDAFLAGEARPLQLDEDDDISGRYTDLPLRRYSRTANQSQPSASRTTDFSQTQPGVRGAVLVNADATPWELQGSPVPNPSSSAIMPSKARVPKGLAIFK